MQPIRTLNDMIVFLQERGDRKRVAVVCANDASTRYAVEKGREMGFIEPIYVDGDDKEECARRAVALCKNGEADILMKGLINTDVLLRAILDKEKGIIRPGHVLTHVAMAEIPKYDKLLFFTDAAVIPVPTLRSHASHSSIVPRRLAPRLFPILPTTSKSLPRHKRELSDIVSLTVR